MEGSTSKAPAAKTRKTFVNSYMEDDDVSYEGSDSNYESGEIEKVTDDDDDNFDENELQKVIPKVKKKVRINSISFYDSNCFVNFFNQYNFFLFFF